MQKISLLSLLVIVGCVTGKPDYKSDWVVLDEASGIPCAPWPQRDRDLQLSEIEYFPQATSFLVRGANRNGSPFAYSKKFDGDYEVDVDEVSNFSVGRGAAVAGLSRVGKNDQLVVVEDRQGKTHVEFRNAASNVVEGEFSLATAGLTAAGLFNTPVGVWIAFRNDDQDIQFVFVDPRKGKELKPALISRKFGEMPKVAVRPKDGTLVVVATSGKQKTKFELALLSPAGSASGPSELSVKAAYQIESFSIAMSGSDLYLAFVDGDSLVGESSLKLAKVSLQDNPAVKWTKSQPLKNMHVNEPVFAPSQKGLELLVLKWVDEESTIARYMVTPDGLGKPTYYGIFKPGSRIMEAFVSGSGRTHTITRSKGQNKWEFLHCRL